MESLLSFWYGLPLFANLRRDPSFDALYKRRLENKGKDAAQSLRTLGTGRQPSLWGKIGENQIPTMLLAGEFDEKFTKISADICQTGRLFEMKIVENCGHTIYIENRQAVIAIIESFFNENAE
jgi:2-succinyl-6-hydroxy-2,4-cyclohexadiene-1-carboxylate synthase